MEISLFGIKVVLSLPWRSLGMLFMLETMVVLSYIFMTRIRKDRILKFANFYTLRKVHGFRSIVPSPWILVTKALVVTFLFLVATESIEVSLVKPVANTDFCIAIDVSQTMLLPDYEPNRLEFVKQSVIDWIDSLPGASKICLVKFSDRATPISPLTLNTFELKKTVKKLTIEPNSTGTAIGEAIFTGISMLEDSDKQKFLILITDGESNVGRNVTEAVKEAERKHVTIYTVGIATTDETTALFNELKDIASSNNIATNFTLPEINPDELREIAQDTGGRFFYTTNESALQESLKNVIFRNERIPLNSDYYILSFISIMLALELIIFSKFGAV